MRSPPAIALLVVLACDEGSAPAPEPAAAHAQTPNESGLAEPAPAPTPRDRRAGPDVESNAEGPEAMPPNQVPSKPPDPLPRADTTLVPIEARTPVVRGGKVVLNVGAEALPGRISPTLTIGCEAPCWQPALVWPAPGESSLELTLFRSKDLQTRGATALGTYRVDAIPVAPPGQRTEVVLALGVVDGALLAHAHVHESGAALALTKVD